MEERADFAKINEAASSKASMNAHRLLLLAKQRDPSGQLKVRPLFNLLPSTEESYARKDSPFASSTYPRTNISVLLLKMLDFSSSRRS